MVNELSVDIATIEQDNNELLKRRPYLRNGLVLFNLKNKYPNNVLLAAMHNEQSDQLTKYGNYDDYYDYRTSDDRIDKLKSYLDDKDVLDLGCHQGMIANDIYLLSNFKSYVGCDIDHSLIRKAIKQVSDTLIVHKYKLPIPISKYLTLEDRKMLLNNNNIQFNYADIMKYKINHSFDVVLCLGLIKWIHLEHTDIGLKQFLVKVYNLLNNSGVFVLELHDIDSYWKKLHPCNYLRYLQLQICPTQIPNILINDIGYSKFKLINMDEQTGGFQRRQLYVFYK